MAFGNKKKQKKETVKQAKQTPVRNTANPLYPPKKESSAAEVVTALGTAAACLALVAVITTHFSYAVQGYPSDPGGYTQPAESTDYTADTADAQDQYQGTGTVIQDESAGETAEAPEAAEEPAEAPTEAPTETPTPTPVQTQTPSPTPETAKTEGPDDYVIPDSSSRYLTEADLKDLTQEQLLHARNEIYARHGRLFQSDELQAYFNGKSWYHGTIAPSEFDANAGRYFNDYEAKNSVFILEYEQKKGYM